MSRRVLVRLQCLRSEVAVGSTLNVDCVFVSELLHTFTVLCFRIAALSAAIAEHSTLNQQVMAMNQELVARNEQLLQAVPGFVDLSKR